MTRVPNTPLLSIRNLRKVYPNGYEALRGIDLDVAEGEFLVVIGLSGAGKSTFIRCLNRLIEPSQGSEIRFRGKDVTFCKGAELRELRRRMAMIFQQFNLIKRASVLTNVLTGSLERQRVLSSVLGMWGTERTEAVNYLKLVGLEGYDRRRASALSGGQQQRVAIARALMQRPDLILADEPVASLDPATSHSVMQYLKELQVSKGMTIIANLHFLSLAREYGTRVVALKAGRVVFDGLPEEISDQKFSDIYGDDAAQVEIR